MKVSILQHDIAWGNPTENRQHLEQLIESAPEADLYVLPEMWSTGFATEPESLAERDDATLQWMKQMALRYDAALAGSVAVEENGKFYNRLYFVKPDGVVEYYDKHHLFSYGGEDKHYACGNKRVVVEWRGVRFLLTVCYDLRFPVWMRYCGDYDAMLCVANWPTVRIDSWNILLRARAIENQSFVVGVNRVGKDPNCEYCGCSAIINPHGQIIVECERHKECSAEAVLDMQMLRAYRTKFPALNEKDKFEITI
ncbi:MAG: amidohydrolase [Bacteroidaceae bacterium]|nr:amidohydrolase [Bacteroidaceae bacterium]